MQTRRAALIKVIASAGVAAAALAFAPEELRDEAWLKLSPKSFRRHVFARFQRPGGEAVYLLGTIHGDHLTTPDYSLLALQSVVLNLRPDLLLVESRPDALAADDWADGPVEMPVASLTARAAGIEVRGMDWWTTDASHEVDSDEREARMWDNIATALPGHRRVLILTGFSHTPSLRARLAGAGYVAQPFADADKERLFDPHGRAFIYPAGMTRYVERRIDVDARVRDGATDPFWRERLDDAIAARRALLRQVAATGEARP